MKTVGIVLLSLASSLVGAAVYSKVSSRCPDELSSSGPSQHSEEFLQIAEMAKSQIVLSTALLKLQVQRINQQILSGPEEVDHFDQMLSAVLELHDPNSAAYKRAQIAEVEKKIAEIHSAGEWINGGNRMGTAATAERVLKLEREKRGVLRVALRQALKDEWEEVHFYEK